MRSVLAAAYAVCVSKWPASMLKMRVHGLISGGVTLLQCAPPSIVTLITPSSEPDQSTLRLRGEGERAVMLPCGPTFTSAAYLPVLAGTGQVCRVRSPLMRVQLSPWSADRHTAFDA